MGNSIIFIIILNCLLVSSLLWLITFIGSYLYDSKQDLNREVHFECGFFSINKTIPNYNLNFIISAIFLILYDVELLLLIPALFNIHIISGTMYTVFVYFSLSIVFTLLMDVESNTIKWEFP